jgi:hypothetical protein
MGGGGNVILSDFHLFVNIFCFTGRDKGERQYKLIYFSHPLFSPFGRIIMFSIIFHFMMRFGLAFAFSL